MSPITIRCFHAINQNLSSRQFYILSKGANAGKPALQPWANCYVATAPNVQMRDFYYWLTYGLYQANSIKPLLRGSVILFINIQETRDAIMPAANAIYPCWQEFNTLLQQLEQFEKRKALLTEIVQKTAALQSRLIRNYFHQKGIKV